MQQSKREILKTYGKVYLKQKKEALLEWRKNGGTDATYKALANAAIKAKDKNLADFLHRLVKSESEEGNAQPAAVDSVLSKLDVTSYICKHF